MHSSQNRIWIVLLACILADAVVHMFTFLYSAPVGVMAFLLSFLVQTGVPLLWGVSAHQRLLPTPARRCLLVSVGFMVLWILLRAVRYRLTPENSVSSARIWYAYYIPQLMLPLLFFFSALSIGARPGRPPSPAWRLLYIPVLLLIAGMLTNGLHHLAFRFDPAAPGDLSTYTHGPLYFITAACCALLVFAGLAVIRRRAGGMRGRRRWLPFLLPVAYVLYLMVFTGQEPPFPPLSAPLQYPEASCYAMLAIWESCIQARMIPSNSDYADFFSRAAIPAVITDNDGRAVYRTACAVPLPRETMEAARSAPVLLGRDTRLSAHPIRGGFVFWTEDLSALHRVNAELSAAAQTLAEETDLLAAENRLKGERARIREQAAIYASIHRALLPELEALGTFLDGASPEDPSLREKLALACVRGAYVKRRANLMLLTAGEDRIAAGELALSLRESLTYLRLCGAECALSGGIDGAISGNAALLLYDLFQWAAELALPGLRSMLVRLARQDGLRLRIVLEADGLPDRPAWPDARAARDGVSLRSQREEGGLYLTLTVSEGGVSP